MTASATTRQTCRQTSRRAFLRASLGAACSAAAHPLITPVVHAAAPGENRLVVIVLRGAMDALDVIKPLGDRDFAALRPALSKAGSVEARDLDGFFALHGGLSDLAPLWDAGEFGAIQAVATPYRDGRSHFDGQDILESGDAAGAVRDGWLNRALAVIPGAPALQSPSYAMAVGRDHMLLLSGDQQAGSWAPSTRFAPTQDAELVMEMLYRDDPLFRAAAEEALALGAGAADAKGKRGREKGAELARFTAKMLNGESRIAAFSLSGWDTHRNQPGAIKGPLGSLAEAILILKRELGPNWETTAVLAMTEFGRTARENGARGTDHGTGGALLYAGGALKGGRVLNGASDGRWPGLGSGALYENRDLLPVEDVRNAPAYAISALFGAPLSAVERDVFPGLQLDRKPGILL